jgi:hypothetical protein
MRAYVGPAIAVDIDEQTATLARDLVADHRV